MRRVAVVLIVVIALVLVGAGLWRYWRADPGASATQQYLTVPVRRGDLEVTVSNSGVLAPLQRWTVRTKVPGTVAAVRVEVGSQVQPGDVLIILDNPDLEVTYEQAVSALEKQRELLEEMLEPPSAEEIDAARWAVRQAELKLEAREREWARLSVSAPCSGQLSWEVEDGAEVTGGELLGVVEDRESMHARILITEDHREYFTPGQECQVWVPGLNLLLAGTVHQRGDAPVGQVAKKPAYEVLVRVANKDGQLCDGMRAVVTIPFEETEPTLVQYNGTLQPVASEEIRAPASGVLEVVVPSGERVQAGQLLCRVDNPELELAVESARRDLEEAREQLEELEGADRNPAYSEADVAQQMAKVLQAERQVEEAVEDLESLVVRAPGAGTVVSVKVMLGDQVGAGAVVAQIADVSSMLMVIPVDELDVPKLAVGQEATVSIDALPDRELQAVVHAISPEGTVQEGITTYQVELLIDEVDGLRIGMTGTASVFLERKADVLMIPVEAVREIRGRKVVYVLEDGQGPVPVTVQLGASNDVWVEVLQGLTEGQRVLLTPPDVPSGLQIPGRLPRMPVPGRRPRPGGG